MQKQAQAQAQAAVVGSPSSAATVAQSNNNPSAAVAPVAPVVVVSVNSIDGHVLQYSPSVEVQEQFKKALRALLAALKTLQLVAFFEPYSEKTATSVMAANSQIND